MNKAKIMLLIIFLIFGISLNIYYYWDLIWTVWAKNYVRDQDIIISLTTTPDRINQLEEPLRCLSRQNIAVRQIYLSVPHIFKRNNTEYKIPDWLESYPNLTILRTEDYGPATKILGALKNAAISDDTIVIAVDDDTCYADNLVLRLAVRAKMYPEQVNGACGSELDFTKNLSGGIVKIFKDKVKVTVLEGFAGIAYKRKFFDASIFDISEEPAYCVTSDDLYISHHLARRQISRVTLNNRFLDVRKNIAQLTMGLQTDALYKLGSSQADRYKQCYLYLKQKFPHTKFNANGIN